MWRRVASLFGGKAKSPPSSSELDAKTLAALRDHGDTLTEPRNLVVWFYGSKGAIDDLRDALIAAGWSNAKCFKPERTNDPFGLHAERTQCATPEAIATLSFEMQQLADVHGAEFDGWECELNTTKH